MSEWRPIDETEAHLVASISDDAACLVYGDWLEEQGDIDRAEFMRVFHTLRGMRVTDPRTVWLSDRLKILRRNVDPAWHARIERTETPVYVEVPAPAPPPAPAPAPPPRRLFPSVEPAKPVWISMHVPRWMKVASWLGGSMLALAVVFYWFLG